MHMKHNATRSMCCRDTGKRRATLVSLPVSLESTSDFMRRAPSTKNDHSLRSFGIEIIRNHAILIIHGLIQRTI